MPAILTTIGQWIYAAWVWITPFLNKNKTTEPVTPTTSTTVSTPTSTTVTPGLGWPEPTTPSYPITVDVPVDVTVTDNADKTPDSTVETPTVTATAHVEHVEVNPAAVTETKTEETTVETN